MPPFNWLYLLHILAAVTWVGTMLVACLMLRPAALRTPSGALQLANRAAIVPYFLALTWVCVLVLPISGVAILRLDYRDFDGAPRYVQAMMGAYVVMVAVFLRVQSLQVPQLRSAVASADWPVGATALKRIRRLVAVNLGLGLAVLLVVYGHNYLQRWPLG